MVAVPVPFAKEYVKSRFGGELEGALANRLGEDATLELVVGERADYQPASAHERGPLATPCKPQAQD